LNGIGFALGNRKRAFRAGAKPSINVRTRTKQERPKTVMPISVLKFGGTSLASHEDFHKIAARLKERGQDIVVVVSAQAGMTDRLLKKMFDLAEQPPAHAIDALLTTGEQQSAALMAAALTVAGRRAEVVPPWHIFETNGDFGDAEIDAVDVAPIHERLRNGIVPVVGGFTGRAPDGRLCTLGRGGSDYTAVALGAALGASVELCKADTDGVYDCDPNSNSDAERFDTMTYDEAFSLASEGAKVLHDKAARSAREGEVELTVRHTFDDGPGTRIGPVADAARHVPITVPVPVPVPTK
jgi:aspartate kinase